MELINSTRMVAGYTMGMEPSGRELLVVVVKGTFRIPAQSGEPLRLHEEQQPLVMSDVYFGEPGLSAPRYEVDFAPRKPRCDILLNATAYAPGGRPTTRTPVGVRIGSWSKSFDVVGDRVWEAGLTGIGASATTPFVQMPITYDRAFGGTDNRSEDPADHAAYMPNPVGRGFHKKLKSEWVDGAPLPNTEETGNAVTWVAGDYRPMSLGAIGRHWEPRYKYAGTYDQRWLDDVFPFLPADFDEQYYQAAPLDQQLAKPLGEQLVTLVNLTPDGRREFVLPHFEAPIHFFPKSGGREDLAAQADTILIEPDLERVLITWRATRPLKKNMFEISQVLVGRKGREWWQQRDQATFPIPIVVEPWPSEQPDEVAR
jgi:hypothetical protein